MTTIGYLLGNNQSKGRWASNLNRGALAHGVIPCRVGRKLEGITVHSVSKISEKWCCWPGFANSEGRLTRCKAMAGVLRFWCEATIAMDEWSPKDGRSTRVVLVSGLKGVRRQKRMS
ncbi:hypothetical protein V6N13_116004 [Hibiscus sabdariffa]|uniref:Uncharacterized protein n=1 Tax=Hibiscus sabdariffa TaxID=183260 RepID=A0ABR2QSH2_9ROSI